MNSHSDFSWPTVSKLAEYAADDQLWQNYLNTKVSIESAMATGTVWPADRSDPQLQLPDFHVVTAVLPDTDPLSADNAARIKVLDDELDSAGLAYAQAVGASFDGSYSEDSRAVFGLTDEEARSLGARFGQVAVFGLRGARWSLIACGSNRRNDRGWRWEPRS
ncbi:DUF3293 domain-containing protein [Gordonia sp. KTR9]|uniref:DUF3293 domain-containing protein n=1 Tax=Gordonia sp. KTR9 TaxID=337191 RepID=UPI00027DE178|nr:DUF3293 domain-containing protein [Gordonia sp. KTR9]AFR49081.1 hypothetical protein KTR9_2444 [Gordonia sp. KTR9]